MHAARSLASSEHRAERTQDRAMSNRYNKQSEKRKVSQINIEPLRGAHPEVLYLQSDHLAVVNALIDILVQVIG